MSKSDIKDNFWLSVLKGSGITLIVALAGVLIFAAVVKLASISDGAIKPVNQFIKVLSVFLGCFLCLRGKRGLIKGLAVGLIGTLITFLVFSLISGEWGLDVSFLLELLFGATAGALSGVIAVNVKKN